jgi:hypothetical protein
MVTLPSIMPAFGSLTSKCPWDPGEGFGFKPPMVSLLYVKEPTATTLTDSIINKVNVSTLPLWASLA